MRASLALAILAAALSPVPVSADYRRINEPNPDDLMHVHIYQLGNGLTVYLSENHETPRFYAEISVRAGSKMDPPNATGLAHYLEHLLFKGTTEMGTLDYQAEKPHLDRITELYEQHFKETDPEKRKLIYAEINKVAQEAAQFAIANEIDQLYKEMGGHAVNAHTWHEETVYKVSLPSNRLPHWALVEAERFEDPVFRIFHTELETVYEEKNRSLDNKDWIIDEAVSEALYKNHPYGQQTTIGTVDHLKNPSLVLIKNYFDTWYVPNNMAISISGDINIEETIKIIDEHFGAWERKELPPIKSWEEQKLTEPERLTVKYKAEPYVMLAFRTASRAHEDVEALKLFDMILDNSVAGLINLNLVQQQKVRAAGSSPAFMNDYGQQNLWGIPKEGQTLEEVEKLLLDQVRLVKEGQFEDWILEAIMTDFKKAQKAQLESDLARTTLMTSSFIGHTGDPAAYWDYEVGEIARLEKLTKEDVIRVANKYFGEGYIAGYRVDEQQQVPSIEKPQIDAVTIDPSRQSAFAKRVLALPFDPMEPTFVIPGKDYKVFDYAEGVKLYYSPNPLNDLFSLSINVEFGTQENNKIAIATRLLDLSGAGDLSAEELKKEWYKLGVDYGVSAGENESFISISGLDENLEPALELLMKVINEPTADSETLEELKKIILVQREDAKKDPATLSAALTNYHRYGDQSYFLRMLPSEQLKQLEVKELHRLITNLLSYKHTISYTGSLPIERVVQILKKHHPIEGKLQDPPPYRFLKAKKAPETEIYFHNKEVAQATVRIEFPNGDYDESLYTPIELYNSYFAGGMSGIVFQELREARALAYSAGAQYANGSRLNDENLVIGVIGSQADKTPDAVAAFLDLFDNLPESPDRFAESLNALDNSYRTSKIGFRGVIGAVRSWERLGLEPDPRRRRFRQLEDAKLENLMAFHAERIKNRPKLISIVGDKNRIDMEALAKFGPITEIPLEQMFVN